MVPGLGGLVGGFGGVGTGTRGWHLPAPGGSALPSGSQFNPYPWSHGCILGVALCPLWGGPLSFALQAAQLSPAQCQPTLKLFVMLKTTLSRTQKLPRSPILSLTRCSVELIT